MPQLSRARADLLRAHCVTAVQDLGYRARNLGDHLVVTGGPFRGQGAHLGFSTLARIASQLPESEWPDMTASVIGQILRAAARGGGRPGSLGFAGTALRERLFPRFVAPERLPAECLAEDYTYARQVGGLPLVLAIREEQSSLFLADIHLAKAGGPEAAWAAAERNLFEGGLGEDVGVYEKDGCMVLHFEDEHPRMASWLAYPERLMEELRIEPGPLGIFFGVPALRMITVHAASEATTVRALQSMVELGGILEQGEVAPLSPCLYWWRPGQDVRAVTILSDAGLVLGLPDSVTDAIPSGDEEHWEVA